MDVEVVAVEPAEQPESVELEAEEPEVAASEPSQPVAEEAPDEPELPEPLPPAPKRRARATPKPRAVPKPRAAPKPRAKAKAAPVEPDIPLSRSVSDFGPIAPLSHNELIPLIEQHLHSYMLHQEELERRRRLETINSFRIV